MNRYVLLRSLGRVSLAVLLTGAIPGLVFGQFSQPSLLPRSSSASTQVGWQQYQSRQIQDAKGFNWMFDTNGNVQSTARAFSSAGQMVINNSGFGMQQRLMSPDGTQYRFTGQANQFPWVREIKLDTKTGTVRYLDTFTNPLPQPQTLAIRLHVATRSSNTAAITSSGQVFQGRAYSGAVPEKQYGFLCQTRSSSYPTPVVFLCGAKSQIRPNIANTSSSNQSFQINYSLTIPPGQSRTLLYGFAQHQRFSSTPQPNVVADLFKPFLAKEFTKDIPRNVRRQIVNNRLGTFTEGSFGPLLEAVTGLADAYDVERGPKSVLVVGNESNVPGALTDGSIEVGTRLGETTLAMADVAGLSGGAGIGRQPRVYLRSGEVLTGTVALNDVRFEADNGLEFELESDRILALLTKVAPTDGKPAPVRTQWLQTQFGDRLELQADEKSIIHGASVWGPVQVPLSSVKVLSRSDEELPVHHIELHDGSKFWLILQGESLNVASKTLGDLSVPVAVIDRIGTVEPPPKEDDEEKATAQNSSGTPGDSGPGSPEGATPATQPVPAQPIPKVTLQPPTSLTPEFRQSLTRSLASIETRLAQVAKEVAEKPNDAPLIQRHFDTLYQVAQVQARLGKYDEALANIGKAKSMQGLDTSRTSRLVYLRGLEVAIGDIKPAPESEPPESPEEAPDSTEETETPEEPEGLAERPKPPAAEPDPVVEIAPLWNLAGENIAAATFRDETVTILAATGGTAIPTANIEQIKRLDDEQGHVSFALVLKDGSTVSGQFESSVLKLSFYGQAWNVPARHVTEVKQPEEEEDEDE